MQSYHKKQTSPYMHQQNINSAHQLPVSDEYRKPTDVINTIIGVLFGLTLFIIACVMFNKWRLQRINFPSDSKGHVCMMDTDDKGDMFPFIYFSDLSNPLQSRYCVKQCPSLGVKPECLGQCLVGYYPNHPVSNRLGAYCIPDDQNIAKQLMMSSGMYKKWNALKAIDYLLIGLAISTALAVMWMLFMTCCPKFIIWLAIILAIILLIVAAVLCFINTTKIINQGTAITLGILAILITFVLLYYLIAHRKRISICGAFMEAARNFLCAKCLTMFYIPIFKILTILFGILTVFQYLAFASNFEPKFSTNDLYYRLQRSGWLTALLVIQTIWGLSFFRDAFNYCVSGCACDWYFSTENNCFQPFKRLICYNFGSVVGGAFVNGFFYLFSLIVSLFCADIECCLCNYLDLVRSDTYAYIYLTGNSYCPSVRQCQYLCYRSRICRQNQSINRIYALSVRLILCLSTLLIVYWIARDNLVGEQIPPYLLLGIFFIGMFVTSYYIDIHVDAGQALQISFLCQYDLDDHSYLPMQKCDKTLKTTINDIDSDRTNWVNNLQQN